jgi:ATP-binding cassette subfamily F protein 3
MILLSVQDIVKHYGPEPVLNGVTFDLRPGERAALVGPNGAGKTTLMQIIAGQSEPHSGRIEIHSRARIGYLEQQPEFPAGRTVWEEARSALDELLKLSSEAERIAAAMAQEPDERARKKLGEQFDFIQHQLHRHDVYQADRRIEQILAGLGFGPAAYEQSVETLSGGQQNRLLLAKLLLSDPDLLLLDEPSNHLDIDATEWLENYLTATDQAMLVVSHDRYFLDRVTNRTLELYQGTVESYPGNFTQYKRLKGERLEVQRKTYEKQQEEIARMEDFIRKNHYGVLATQAEDRRKKLERIERVPPPREIKAPPMSFPAASRTGDIVLRIEGLSKAYDRQLFKDLTFDVLRGEKWGILGPNGTGKTTLLRCILGETEPDSGRSMIGSGVKLGYFDQLLSGIPLDAEVADAVRPDHKEFMIQQRRDLLAKFGLIGDTVLQKVSSLSGGERNRTALARLAALDANVLLLDEPTNHLDLWARDSLEKALKSFDGTVIFVSHDRYFLNQVADKLLIVQPDRFRVIEGNYDTYLHLIKQGFALDARAGVGAEKAGEKKRESESANAQRTEKEGRRKRKFPYRKPGDVEADIHKQEARIQELQTAFTSPEILRDGTKVKKLQAELSDLEQSLPRLYEHWEEALEMNQ